MSIDSSAPPSSSPPEGTHAWPDDAVEVAVVTGAWGVRGGLRIKPFSADPQALFSSKRWWWKVPEGSIGSADAARPPLALEQPLRIASAKEQGDAVVATVHDLQDRTVAEACKGLRLFVPRSSFPSTDEDEFYWVDLIGLRVVNRQGVDLGSVVGLLQTGPHAVLRIDAGAGRETLIPFVGVYVDAVDRDARRITVDWDPQD